MPARREPFQACVWRPGSKTDDYVYKLVGCTYIPAAEPDNVYQVKVKPWIPVRRGDVLGYTFMRNPLYSTEATDDENGNTDCVWKDNNLIRNFNELEYGEKVRFDSKLNKCAFSINAELRCKYCRDFLNESA